MLSQKCTQIISYLCTRIHDSEFVSIDELTKKYNVSERTIRYDIDKIDYFLKTNSFKILLREKGVGIRLDETEENIKKIKEVIRESDIQNYIMSKQERMLFIILMLFKESGYTKYEEIAEKLFVSRKTAIEDVRTIKEEIGENSLKSTKHGIMFDVTESRRRKVLLDYLLDMFTPLEIWEIPKDIFPNVSVMIEREWRNMINYKFVEACEKALHLVESKNKKMLSDDYYYLLIIIMAFSLTRKNNGFKAEAVNSEKGDAFLLKYFSEVERALGISISTEERQFIQNEVERLHLSDNAGAGMKADLIAEQFIIRISEETGEEYYLDQILRQSLRQHFERVLKPSIKYRPANGAFDKYIEQNQVLYNGILKLLRENPSIILPEDINSEAVLIALHFLASGERKPALENRYRILVVCMNGIGIAKIISALVKKHFPEIDIIDTASLHKVEDLVEKNQPDFILTTIPVSSKNVNVIEVKPVLSENDIEKIRMFIKTHPKNNENRIPNIYDKLIKIIGETCDIKDKETLEERLKSILEIEKHVRKELRLKTLLTPQTIQVNVVAASWEEAIKKSADPLFKEGFIEKRYIDAMINNINKMGPYVVIAPGIAMPHALPNDGVIKSCISLTVLKDEVKFGNAANDPVKLIFCIGSKDGKDHMNVLSELIGAIGDKALMAKIKSADSQKQVIKAMESSGKL
jgi:mannitol/fructose-specific phosphotransferase system IIA component (Ntr-type)/transcriptional antiterminator